MSDIMRFAKRKLAAAAIDEIEGHQNLHVREWVETSDDEGFPYKKYYVVAETFLRLLRQDGSIV